MAHLRRMSSGCQYTNIRALRHTSLKLFCGICFDKLYNTYSNIVGMQIRRNAEKEFFIVHLFVDNNNRYNPIGQHESCIGQEQWNWRIHQNGPENSYVKTKGWECHHSHHRWDKPVVRYIARIDKWAQTELKPENNEAI